MNRNSRRICGKCSATRCSAAVISASVRFESWWRLRRRPGRAVLELYGAYSRMRDDRAALFERLDGDDRATASASASRLASEEITDFVQARGNYFPLLEEAAERLWRDARLEYGDVYAGLVRHLQESFGVRVKIVPFTESRNTVRRYDENDRTVLLSEVLPQSNRNFQLANQIGLLQFRATIDSYLEGVRFANPDTPAFARIALANYFAGAVLMPYESFLDATRTARHDVDILENRFGVSFEQACHRLTTLQRPVRAASRSISFVWTSRETFRNVSRPPGSRFPDKAGRARAGTSTMPLCRRG